MRGLLPLIVVLVATSLAAQSVDVINTTSPAHVRATEARTPRGQAAPLPLGNFSVARGMGILEDDGNSYWPGFPANFQAPATFRIVPTASNTFTIRRVAYTFDDPSSATVIFDGAKRPILGYVDANYISPNYSLPAPFILISHELICAEGKSGIFGVMTGMLSDWLAPTSRPITSTPLRTSV